MNIVLFTSVLLLETGFLADASNPWYGCPQDKDSDPGISYECALNPVVDCPDGWFSFETNCYTFFTQAPLSYTEARLNCEVNTFTSVLASFH